MILTKYKGDFGPSTTKSRKLVEFLKDTGPIDVNAVQGFLGWGKEGVLWVASWTKGVEVIGLIRCLEWHNGRTCWTHIELGAQIDLNKPIECPKCGHEHWVVGNQVHMGLKLTRQEQNCSLLTKAPLLSG